MITLHRLNGSPIVINAELIESLDAGQETVVSLATGNRFVVKESAEKISELVVEYRRKVNSGPKAVNPIAGYKRESA